MEPATGGVEERQLVMFHLGVELYGVEISRVHEIVRMQTITRVPGAPKFVEGIINLRGSVIPVIDLRHRFDLPIAAHTRASRIVVVEIGGLVVGLIVDSVREVLRINPALVDPPGSVVAGVDAGYLHGIARLPEGLVILLDLDQLLAGEQRRVLEVSA